MKFGQIMFFTLVAVKLLFCTILSLAIITRVSFYFSMHKVLVPLKIRFTNLFVTELACCPLILYVDQCNAAASSVL